jgi:hypothetical protein
MWKNIIVDNTLNISKYVDLYTGQLGTLHGESMYMGEPYS